MSRQSSQGSSFIISKSKLYPSTFHFPQPPTKSHSDIYFLSWSSWFRLEIVLVDRNITTSSRPQRWMRWNFLCWIWCVNKTLRSINRILRVPHQKEVCSKITKEVSIGIWQHGTGSFWSILKELAWSSSILKGGTLFKRKMSARKDGNVTNALKHSVLLLTLKKKRARVANPYKGLKDLVDVNKDYVQQSPPKAVSSHSLKVITIQYH